MYLLCPNFIVVICYTVTINARNVIDKTPYLAILLEVTKCLRSRWLFQYILNYTYCWVTAVLQVLLISNKKNCRCFIGVGYVKRNGGFCYS